MTATVEQLRQCATCGKGKPLTAYEHSDGSVDDICFRCRATSQQVVTPPGFSTKTRSKARPRKPNPAWERGTPTDSRGMPWLKPGTVNVPLGSKAVSENRHLIEEHERRKRNAPAPPSIS